MTEPRRDAIALRDLSFSYPRVAPVIQHCTLSVAPGSVLGVIGPNGSGKSTLLKLMVGALTPSAGTVTAHGTIGYVPQFMHISFAYSVRDVVLMGRAQRIGLFATPSASDEAAALQALDRVGMLRFAGATFEQLSGGERQLVALARALVSDAEVLVLDEPMAALDIGHQQLVMQWIRRLAREDGLAIVFTTHQPQHADVVADSALLMSGSGRTEHGLTRDILTTERLATLFGVTHSRVNGASGRTVLIPDWNV